MHFGKFEMLFVRFAKKEGHEKRLSQLVSSLHAEHTVQTGPKLSCHYGSVSVIRDWFLVFHAFGGKDVNLKFRFCSSSMMHGRSLVNRNNVAALLSKVNLATTSCRRRIPSGVVYLRTYLYVEEVG